MSSAKQRGRIYIEDLLSPEDLENLDEIPLEEERYEVEVEDKILVRDTLTHESAEYGSLKQLRDHVEYSFIMPQLGKCNVNSASEYTVIHETQQFGEANFEAYVQSDSVVDAKDMR
jgi:hypothetical protein